MYIVEDYDSKVNNDPDLMYNNILRIDPGLCVCSSLLNGPESADRASLCTLGEHKLLSGQFPWLPPREGGPELGITPLLDNRK